MRPSALGQGRAPHLSGLIPDGPIGELERARDLVTDQAGPQMGHQLIGRGEMKHADLVRERGLVDGDDMPVAAAR